MHKYKHINNKRLLKNHFFHYLGESLNRSRNQVINFKTSAFLQLSNDLNRKARLLKLVVGIAARRAVHRIRCARTVLPATINGKARANHGVPCEFMENGGKCSMFGRGIERTNERTKEGTVKLSERYFEGEARASRVRWTRRYNWR